MTDINQEDLDILNAVMEEQHREIPENSKSIIVSDTTSRFSGAIWYDKVKQTSVTLAGVGGIGSWCALLLAKLNVLQLIMYDFDRVEATNIAGQFYGINQIDNSKVSAVANSIRNYASYNDYICRPERFIATSPTSDIMICGFDNMAARKTFFEAWLNRVNHKLDKSKLLFIDGRLNAEEFQIFAIQGDDINAIEKYRNEYLFDDSEVEEAVCSYKQTSFMSNMIASYMINIFVNFIANQCDPIIPRDVPFFTSYTADTMFTKMIM